MNYEELYARLFAPVSAAYGPLDPKTRFHLIGFDGGGPVNYCTVGADHGEPFITCVTCELAPRAEQFPNSTGTYELLMTCNDEEWCCSTLTRIAQMTLDVAFDDAHTLDIQPWVDPAFHVQGIAFEQFAAISFEGRNYGILRCHGITRPELELAQRFGVPEVLQRRRTEGIYPRTEVPRQPDVAGPVAVAKAGRITAIGRIEPRSNPTLVGASALKMRLQLF